jgi:hypothetical protein
MKNTIRIHILSILLIVGGACAATAQSLDISSGGTPTITGALNGSVTGSSSTTTSLSVSLNFGEISPANTNSLVKVVIPIGIRSTGPYQVQVSIAGSSNTNPQMLQGSDVGFGVNNLRTMGNNAQGCTRSSHVFRSPFNNDPSTGITINSAGRAVYTSSLSSVGTSAVLLSGPRLSSTKNADRQSNNGYIFDAIFVLTPQFFASAGTTGTITFSISNGPTAAC